MEVVLLALEAVVVVRRLLELFRLLPVLRVPVLLRLRLLELFRFMLVERLEELKPEEKEPPAPLAGLLFLGGTGSMILGCFYVLFRQLRRMPRRRGQSRRGRSRR